MRVLSVRPSRHGLDLTQPLQVRQYLRLLREDRLTGIRVRENLSVPKRRLGFSFSSNRFGLRGPHDTACTERGSGHIVCHGSRGGRRIELV